MNLELVALTIAFRAKFACWAHPHLLVIPHMALVFVSYARQDRDMALKPADRLRKEASQGMEIAIDEAADGELANTANDTCRPSYVRRRLRNANAVVPVLTRSYAESDPCWL